MRHLRGSLYLILAAMIWGMAFSAQSEAGAHMGPFFFTAARSLITFAALLPFILAGGARAKSTRPPLRAHIRLGVPLGVVMFLATSLQQIGIMNTTVAKSGFITALYIVLVPILGLLLFRRRVCAHMWIGVALSVVGLGLLCLDSDLSIGFGDLITLLCAAVFAVHIIIIDRWAGALNAPALCCIQFGVAGLLALGTAFLRNEVVWEGVLACWPSLLYVGVASGALGYTLQIAGQRYTEPTLASLILCLESVFAALGGWMLLGQTLLPREIAGCVVMLAACVLAQLPEKKRGIA